MKVKSFVVDGNVIDLESSASGVIETTWAHLQSLKHEKQLIPGATYRIVDYDTIIYEPETQTMGHQFDILVMALSSSKLSENAHAIHHEGDTYFANSKLEAWKLQYCLDNDRDRFGWADETNGKGVIYRLTDEFGNSCPYDFKNIKFRANIGDVNSEFWYTFACANNKSTDLSLSDINYVRNNYLSDNYYQVYHSDSEELYGQSGFIPATGNGSFYDGSQPVYDFPWTRTEILQLPFFHFLGPEQMGSYVCPNCCVCRVEPGQQSPLMILAPQRGAKIYNRGPLITESNNKLGADVYSKKL